MSVPYKLKTCLSPACISYRLYHTVVMPLLICTPSLYKFPDSVTSARVGNKYYIYINLMYLTSYTHQCKAPDFHQLSHVFMRDCSQTGITSYTSVFNGTACSVSKWRHFTVNDSSRKTADKFKTTLTNAGRADAQGQVNAKSQSKHATYLRTSDEVLSDLIKISCALLLFRRTPKRLRCRGKGTSTSPLRYVRNLRFKFTVSSMQWNAWLVRILCALISYTNIAHFIWTNCFPTQN